MDLDEANLIKQNQPDARKRLVDRHLIALVLLAATVLLLRSIAINAAQSERIDDEYHIQRGIAFLDHHLVGNDQLPLNDPPTGEALTILPLWLFNVWPHAPLVGSALWGQKISADFILQAIGLWKSLLFIPAIIIAFIWARMLYGLKSGWLTAVWFLADPTIAAHVPLPTPDALAAETIFIACFFAWLYFRNPTRLRLLCVSILSGVAMTIKHTAIILPAVLLSYATMQWVVLPWRQAKFKEGWRNTWRSRVQAAILFIAIMAFTIWTFCLFDISRPSVPSLSQFGVADGQWQLVHPLFERLTAHSLPGGIYISSLLGAQLHAEHGHPGYLWGVWGNEGRWYYFPIIALYKVPIGFGIFLLLATFSISRVSLKAAEVFLLIAIIAWSALLMTSKINLGFRHFLPAYFFMILLASRVGMLGGAIWQGTAWIAAAAGAIAPLFYWPDLISYTNLPGVNVWFHLNDSNIDWGQGLKYARQWIDAHPDRKISIRDYAWGEARLFSVRQRVGNLPALLNLGDAQPTEGVLIISAMALARDNAFKPLRTLNPDAVLGHCMLVYDLDRLRMPGEPFHWSRPAPTSRR